MYSNIFTSRSTLVNSSKTVINNGPAFLEKTICKIESKLIVILTTDGLMRDWTQESLILKELNALTTLDHFIREKILKFTVIFLQQNSDGQK